MIEITKEEHQALINELAKWEEHIIKLNFYSKNSKTIDTYLTKEAYYIPSFNNSGMQYRIDWSETCCFLCKHYRPRRSTGCRPCIIHKIFAECSRGNAKSPWRLFLEVRSLQDMIKASELWLDGIKVALASSIVID